MTWTELQRGMHVPAKDRTPIYTEAVPVALAHHSPHNRQTVRSDKIGHIHHIVVAAAVVRTVGRQIQFGKAIQTTGDSKVRCCTPARHHMDCSAATTLRMIGAK